MIDRRTFLRWAIKAAAAVTLNPSLQLPEVIKEEAAKEGFTLYDDIIALELEKIRPLVMQMFERDNAFYQALMKKPVGTVSSRDMRIPLRIKP